MKKLSLVHPPRLLFTLTGLTLGSIIAQISLFFIHYRVSDLLDSLIKSSLTVNMLHPSIVFPLVSFIAIQVAAYILFIYWIALMANRIGQLVKWGDLATYGLGIFLWLTGAIAIVSFNSYFYPDSFFSRWLTNYPFWTERMSHIVRFGSASLLTTTSLLAFFLAFFYKRDLIIASLLLMLVLLFFTSHVYYQWISHHPHHPKSISKQPNVIVIGLDSLRPDFIGYFNQPHKVNTPHLDQLLTSAAVMEDAYTPLARTFPSWISILTGKYPLHHFARTNLGDPTPIIANDTLAKKLKAAGYETLYATDEKRFSNITHEYGFDHVIGPRMGIDDFILGGLSDFPLTNLLVNSSLGQMLFPYNFANRAAAITYDPNTFLQQIELQLSHRSNKPLFIAVHFCVSHWPYTWAHPHRMDSPYAAIRYGQSVEAVDAQLGAFLHIAKQQGLLDNSVLVILSDHGTTVGIPGDRIIAEENYLGKPDQLKWITRYKLDLPPPHQGKLSLNTSFGQGTDVLSLKQYHVLLAFQGLGKMTIPAHSIHDRAALLDITPTLLDLLNLPAIDKADGISLKKQLLLTHSSQTSNKRPLYFETDLSLSAIEKNNIFVNQVLRRAIGLYSIDPKTGRLSVKSEAHSAILHNKQRAILQGDWLLAKYPESLTTLFSPAPKKTLQPVSYSIPSYFVIANIKTGQWSIGLHSAFAKTAPIDTMLKELVAFYGDEVQCNNC